MAKIQTSNKLRKSFSVIILVSLMIIFLVGFDDLRAKIRDTKRRADIREVVKALDIYYHRHGYYPETDDKDWQDWDATYEPSGEPYQFIAPLMAENIITRNPIDPVNSKTYFYRYKKFSYGSYDCLKEFYILQIVNFETSQDNHGFGNCPQFDFVEGIPNGYTVMGVE